MGKRVIEDGLLDLGRDPVGVRPLGAGQAINEPVSTVGLVIAADLVELLAAIAHQLAGAADVFQVLGELQQRQLAACYLLVRGHVVLPQGWMILATSS
jgi:hypothetical protein